MDKLEGVEYNNSQPLVIANYIYFFVVYKIVWGSIV